MKKLFILSVLAMVSTPVFSQTEETIPEPQKTQSTVTGNIVENDADIIISYPGLNPTRNEIKALSHVNTAAQNRPYKFRLRTGTTVAGSVLIGGSFAAYAISNTSLADRISRVDDKYATQIDAINERYSSGLLAAAQYNKEIENVNGQKRNDIKKINDRQKTLNYVCAGTSIVGAIVIIAGLHKDYQNGIPIAENLYCDPLCGGASFILKF